MRHDAAARACPERPNEHRRFIHRRLLGAAKGLLSGGPLGAAGGFFASGRATRSTSVPRQFGPQGPQTRTTSAQFGPFGLLGRFRSTTGPVTTQVGQGVGIGVLQVGGSGGGPARGPVLPTSDGCPKGFHLNKSSYNLKSGARIEERTLCVKNRRRNNDNGAASLRAARRLIGRKKQQDKIDEALKGIIKPPARRRAKKALLPGPGGIVAIGN